jgi:thiol-disulfide isomerase/thioredoxin
LWTETVSLLDKTGKPSQQKTAKRDAPIKKKTNMTNFYPKTISLLILIFLSSFWTSSYSQDSPVVDTNLRDYKMIKMIGQNAPDWIVTNGVSISLSDFKGYIVLLEFSGKFCGPCRKAEKDIHEIDSLFQKDSLIIIKIVYDPHDKKHAPLKFNVTSKIGQETIIDCKDFSAKYKIVGFPVFFLIDKDGTISFFYNGFVSSDTKTKLIDEIMKLK